MVVLDTGADAEPRRHKDDAAPPLEDGRRRRLARRRGPRVAPIDLL